MCNCEQVIQPDPKLTKMLVMVKYLCIIHFLSAFTRFGTGSVGDMIYDLFCFIFLILSYKTVYFMYMTIYILFSLFNGFYLFVKIGYIIQLLIMGSNLPSRGIVSLAFTLYLFIFYIFAIILTFPVYKEMKAQAMGSNGGGSAYRPDTSQQNGLRGDDIERQAISSQQPTQPSSGFAAFTGRGVQVGGS